jgi:hypothetical protein
MVRALKESERAQHAEADHAEDAPLTAETQREATEPAAF